jgi:putative ABC transport system permease protein
MVQRIDQIAHDLRFALRQFYRTPGLTFAAVVALACGIGGLATVFALIDAVVLRPLPVSKPHELVTLRDPSFSYPVFEQVRAHGGMFRGVFAWTERELHANWTNEAEPSSVLLVSGAFHETLGLRPATGRLLTEGDVGHRAGDAQAVAVLSEVAWRTRYGKDPTVIGRTLRIEGQPFTIVGVTAPGFFGVAAGLAPEVTIPITMLPRLRSDQRDILTSGQSFWLNIMGRLRPGLSIEQADAAFQPVWTRALRATLSPEWTPRWRARYVTFTSGLEPGASGYSPVRSQFQSALWLLFGLVTLVLLVACATVANLLLAAAAGRRRELALRLALGASRIRLVRQLFAEGLLLASMGGALGWVFSTWAAELLVQRLATSHDPVTLTLGADVRGLAFTVGAIVMTALVFTVAPIVRAARIVPGPVLKAGARQAGGDRRPAGVARVLVAAQVALSIVLLAGSALFVRNLVALVTKDPGFDRHGLLLVQVDVLSPVSARVALGDRAQDLSVWYGELLRRLRDTPGVRSASLSFMPPISNQQGYWFDVFTPEGGDAAAAWPATASGRIFVNAVSPGYFTTIGAALVAGRDVSDSDSAARPAVVVINESMAAAYFGRENPLGRRLRMSEGAGARSVEVIGVVRDSVYQRLQDEQRRVAFVPYMQSQEMLERSALYAEVRAADGGSIGEALQTTIRSLDATAPIRIETMRRRIDESLVQERLVTLIATFLGCVSLLLACSALGAERHEVMALVLREALVLTLAGAVAGMGLALAGGRLVAGFLSGLKPTDPPALAAAVALMILTAMLAGYLPARRAARVDPIEALRAE